MLKIYGFYRSSAAYRVCIALELKALDWESIPVNLRLDEQKQDSFLQNNPQGLVPVLDKLQL